MRSCWHEAMKHHQEWDYYLLLNDDTELMSYVFSELISTENYSKKVYGKQAIVSGTCCSISDHTKMTYGGYVFTNWFLRRSKNVWPVDEPIMCDTINANVMLVPSYVVNHIGIFYDKYQHAYADFDYSVTARKNKIPVLLSLRTCASCDYDHVDKKTKVANLLKMSVAERKNYYRHPLHSMKDGLIYNWRISPLKIPGVIILDLLKIYFPHIYYKWCHV
jgi:GT2 family glycosyltransferase